MKQALSANIVSEKTNPQSYLASLYPQLLYLATKQDGKNPFAGQGVREQTEEARRAGIALKQLQRGLTGDRKFAGADYFSKPEFLSAYLLYYWPVSFLQTSLALSELKTRSALTRCSSVLDLGAGPGPAAAAAAMFGAKSFLLLDKSREALQQAIFLLRASTALTTSAASATSSRNAATFASSSSTNLETIKTLPEGEFDLVIACHSANELWKDNVKALDKRARLFGQAVQRLSAGGILLIIEPSALVTSRPALALRDRLLKDFSGSLYCVAPCPGSYPCPILAAGEGRNCHSTWTWEPYEPVAALASAAGLDRDSVKATWFALKKQNAFTNAPKGGKVLGAPNGGAEEKKLSGRVISEPMLNKAGRLRYILCTEAGLATLSAKAGNSEAETAGFFSLRRGDMIEASQLERREGDNNFGFVPESKLRIAMKAPKVCY
jgi:SAM-dependent methyltransferase